ncbi:MAG: flagellar type III secretion system pore protein FliP [Hyphomicrobiales bacterium]|nr:flagellar type III secretion system pore protein FliP [Hyphomicrobiales bacterium]
MWTRKHILIPSLLLALTVAGAAMAQTINIDLGDATGSATGRIIQLVILLTVLSLAPSLLMMVTSFTRIIVVLSLLRSALGIQQTPPNPVLISLALFLTGFIMAPVFVEAYNQGVVPLMEEKIEQKEAYEKTVAPFHAFMIKHVRESDLGLFVQLAGNPEITTPEATPLHILIPAFMISELRRAFEIGFLIFIPFLIIDMMVASTLMSMGMMMLPPVMISLPFKLIFFVMVDGWHMLGSSLVESFM